MEPSDGPIVELAQQWRERLKRWQKSGLGGRKFAEQEGVNPKTFYYWSRRLGLKSETVRGRRSTKQAAARLLPVMVTSTASATEPVRTVEVILRGGDIVRLPPHFEEEALRRIVRVLGGGR